MDDAGGLRGLGAHRDGPGLDLHLAGREVALQAERAVGHTREHVQAARLDAQVSQVLGGLGGIELGELGLDLGADRDGLDAIDGGEVVSEGVLVHVGDVDDRLHGEQEQVAGGGALLGRHVHGGGTVAVVEPGDEALGNLELGRKLLVAAGLLLELGNLLLEGLDVGQDELGHDGLGVARRVNEVGAATHLAHDVGVGEVAHDLADGVGLADVGEELVAEALALVGTLDQAGDVDELNRGRHDAPRVDDVGERLQALIGHVDDADVGVDRGERVVGGQTGLFGEGGKEGRLAHVGQADDSDGKGHGCSFFAFE